MRGSMRQVWGAAAMDMVNRDWKFAGVSWSATMAILSILLLPVHLCVVPAAAVEELHPGRRLFLKGGSEPFAASHKGEEYTWYNLDFEGSTQVSVGSIPLVQELGSFLALFYWLDAAEFRGRRVKLSAQVAGLDIDDRRGAWAGLFMRVDAADGSVMAFDNMSARRYHTRSEILLPETYAHVVLDVPPGLANDADTCPALFRIPFRIAAGFFVVGTVGKFTVDNVVIQGVDDRVLETEGPRNLWQNPCLDNLGAGYIKPQDPAMRRIFDGDDEPRI